jgi:acetyl esterase/lipase
MTVEGGWEVRVMRLKPVIPVIVALTLLATGCAGDDTAAPTTSTTASTSTTTQPTTTVATTTTTALAPTTTVEDQAVNQSGKDIYRGIVEQFLPAGAVTEWELAYATWEEGPLTLDMYAPVESAGAPIVMFFPGRMEYHALPEMVGGLVEEGALVFVVRYPLIRTSHQEFVDGLLGTHGAGARAVAEGVACAINFAQVRASELGSDDPVVALTGLSAGGGVAAYAALFGADLEARWDEFAAEGGPPRQVECEITDGSTHVDALVGMAGGYDLFVPIYDGAYGRAYQQERDPELWEFLSSSIGVNPDLTVRLIHGTSDWIPVGDAAEFESLLSDAGYDVQFTTFDGGHVMPPPELYLPTIVEVLGR